MDIIRIRFYPPDEFANLGIDERNNLPPGSAWMLPWWYDPKDPHRSTRDQLHGIFSEYYWRDWAGLRPPINVICPDGNHWVVDQKSKKTERSDGRGWVVMGTLPMITCSPSIDFSPAYHGYLQNGAFTADINGEAYKRGAVYKG